MLVMKSSNNKTKAKSAFKGAINRPHVKVLFFDFDGVLTDNRVWVFEDGREAVACNRADGIGFTLLRKAGFDCVIVSTEENPVVARRAAKLRLTFRQAVKDKGEAIRELCSEYDISPDESAFVGNDVNDLPAMQVVGTCICPSDAHPDIRGVCDHVLRTAGGFGVVRELADRHKELLP